MDLKTPSGATTATPKSTSAASRKFNPGNVQKAGTEPLVWSGEQRTGAVYVYNERIRLAVEVGVATGRPILVRGGSGWGKSSLARSAAIYLGRRYYEKVVSSRTQVRDLLYDADVLQ